MPQIVLGAVLAGSGVVLISLLVVCVLARWEIVFLQINNFTSKYVSKNCKLTILYNYRRRKTAAGMKRPREEEDTYQVRPKVFVQLSEDYNSE